MPVPISNFEAYHASACANVLASSSDLPFMSEPAFPPEVLCCFLGASSDMSGWVLSNMIRNRLVDRFNSFAMSSIVGAVMCN